MTTGRFRPGTLNDMRLRAGMSGFAGPTGWAIGASWPIRRWCGGRSVSPSTHNPRRKAEYSAYFFFVPGSTGRPAAFHAVKPPSMCLTGSSPMSCAVLVASAERQPPAQKNTKLLPEAKNGL